MSVDSDELDKVRRGWVFEMTPDELARLRAEMSAWTPKERARVRYQWGDAIAERVIDEVWHLMGREPTAEEFREMGVLLREAADYAEREATLAAAKSPATGTPSGSQTGTGSGRHVP